MICAWIETSSADTGSSSTMSFGSTASARATPMRWRWPPENSCGKRLTCSGARPTRSSSSLHAALDVLLASAPARSSAIPTIWPTRLRGFSDAYGSWKTICISRRSGMSSLRDACVTSVPRKRTAPPVGSSRRMIVRDSVVLPQPDSPTSPSVSPSTSVNVMSSTACTAPTWCVNRMPCLIGKCSLTCSTSSSGLGGGGGAVALRRGSAHAASRLGFGDGGLGRQPDLAGLELAQPALALGLEPAAVACGADSAPSRASSGGTCAHCSCSCGQRGRRWQPSGRLASDGGRPGIVGSRVRRGRSIRVIAPMSPHV